MDETFVVLQVMVYAHSFVALPFDDYHALNFQRI